MATFEEMSSESENATDLKDQIFGVLYFCE